jgi:hypothetical protein
MEYNAVAKLRIANAEDTIRNLVNSIGWGCTMQALANLTDVHVGWDNDLERVNEAARKAAEACRTEV